jgi:hypothetical protein
MLDPDLREPLAGESYKKAPSREGRKERREGRKERRGRKRTKKQLDGIIQVLDDIGLPALKITKADVKTLEQIQQVTQVQCQLERLKDVEAEIVEREKWNYDASAELFKLARRTNRMPFKTRAQVLEGASAVDSKNKGRPTPKGKERALAEEDLDSKRAIYRLLPLGATDSLSGKSGKSTGTAVHPTNAATP